MQHVLHFAEDGDTSGYFPQLARWHDRGRFRMSFGTLKPIAPRLREFMEAQGVECLSLDCRRRHAYPRAAWRLARFLRGRRVDVLHTHLFEPSAVGLTAGVAARTPVRVMTRHYSDYHTRIDKRWHVRVDQLCTRLAHAVIAVSAHTAEHMVAVEGAAPGKVHTVHNGIDFGRVRLSAPDAPASLRRRFGGDAAHLLLIVARLHPEKGHEHLFKAVARLRGQVSRPVVLLVAGEGPFEAEYRRRVAALGLTDAVRFLGFRTDVADLMAAADLVVLPSVAEAFGLVLTEAVYLGTPVVATRVGGIPEIIRDGVDGVLVPPSDPEALAEALARLLNDPAARGRLSGRGREWVRDRFSFETMVRSYESLYDRLAAHPGRPGTTAAAARGPAPPAARAANAGGES